MNAGSARPRILHLIDTGGPGGAETVLLQLLQGLGQDNWEHHVVVPVRDWLSASLSERGIAHEVLPSVGSFDLRYLAGIRRLIRKHQVDLIQTHLFTTAVYGGVAGGLSGVPVVSTIHGIVDTGPAGFRRALKYRLIDRRQNRIVLVSRLLRKAIDDQAKLRDEIVRVVPNGIDVTTFRPLRDTGFREELGIPAEGILIGALGNVRAPKDYANLLESAAILRSRLPRFAIAIIGDIEGEPRLYEELLARRSSLGLEGIVHFCGFRDEIPRLLNNLDVYVLSSEREGLPLAMLQAMATGVPVVATKCGGPQELVANGVNGLLVASRSPVELAEALYSLATQPEMAAVMGAAGRDTVVADFAVETMVEGYERIYRELLGSAKRATPVDGEMDDLPDGRRAASREPRSV